jgi:hypothetical protein
VGGSIWYLWGMYMDHIVEKYLILTALPGTARLRLELSAGLPSRNLTSRSLFLFLSLFYYYFILSYFIPFFLFNLFFLRGSPCSACSYIVMATSLFPRPLATHQRIRLASNTESKWADASLLSTTLMYPLFAHSSPAPKPALASFPSSLPSFLVFFFFFNSIFLFDCPL